MGGSEVVPEEFVGEADEGLVEEDVVVVLDSNVLVVAHGGVAARNRAEGGNQGCWEYPYAVSVWKSNMRSMTIPSGSLGDLVHTGGRYRYEWGSGSQYVNGYGADPVGEHGQLGVAGNSGWPL